MILLNFIFFILDFIRRAFESKDNCCVKYKNQLDSTAFVILYVFIYNKSSKNHTLYMMIIMNSKNETIEIAFYVILCKTL